MARTIVIGDVHGCSKALRAIIESIGPCADDTIIFLGDYVDRGPDAKGVIDQLVELKGCCNLVPLKGNHEVMLASVCQGLGAEDHWLLSGGRATLASYGGRLDRIPESHRDLLGSLVPYHETPDAIFLHANYDPLVDLSQQTEASLFWTHLTTSTPGPHQSGKTVYLGHTPQGSGMPLDLGHLVCLDTYCFGGLWLSALDIHTRELWQASYHGHLRRRPFQAVVDLARRLWSRR